MAKTIKMCDLSEDVVANVFVMLNPGRVKYDKDEYRCRARIPSLS